jgi:hypothetical protein
MSLANYYLPSFLGFFFNLLFLKIILAKIYNNNLAKLIKITLKNEYFQYFPNFNFNFVFLNSKNHTKMAKITSTKCGHNLLVLVH